jgi:hypothetical protein
MKKHVGTVAELLSATGDSRVATIVLTADLVDVPSFDLLPGQTLRSVSGQQFALAFAPGVDGVRLSSDNSILSLDLHASLDERAVWNDYSMPTVGRINLSSLNTFGRVELLAKDHVGGGHVEDPSTQSGGADRDVRPRRTGIQCVHWDPMSRGIRSDRHSRGWRCWSADRSADSGIDRSSRHRDLRRYWPVPCEGSRYEPVCNRAQYQRGWLGATHRDRRGNPNSR